MCARRRTYFSLCRQRKVGKRKATPLAVSLRFAADSLRCSGMGRRCGTRFAATPLRSDSRSESEHEAWSRLAQPMPAPRPALLGTARGDGGQHGPSLRSAPEPSTGYAASSGTPRRPRSRPSQRPPWPGLYRPVAVPLTKQEGAEARGSRPAWAGLDGPKSRRLWRRARGAEGDSGDVSSHARMPRSTLSITWLSQAATASGVSMRSPRKALSV